MEDTLDFIFRLINVAGNDGQLVAPHEDPEFGDAFDRMWNRLKRCENELLRALPNDKQKSNDLRNAVALGIQYGMQAGLFLELRKSRSGKLAKKIQARIAKGSETSHKNRRSKNEARAPEWARTIQQLRRENKRLSVGAACRAISKSMRKDTRVGWRTIYDYVKPHLEDF